VHNAADTNAQNRHFTAQIWCVFGSFLLQSLTPKNRMQKRERKMCHANRGSVSQNLPIVTKYATAVRHRKRAGGLKSTASHEHTPQNTCPWAKKSPCRAQLSGHLQNGYANRPNIKTTDVPYRRLRPPSPQRNWFTRLAARLPGASLFRTAHGFTHTATTP